MLRKPTRNSVIGTLMVMALSLCFGANAYFRPVIRGQAVPNVAEVVLEAPEEAEVGELIRFDLTGSVAQSFKWKMVPATVDFEVFCEGKKAVFSARKPGTYMFIIACAYDGTVDVVTHTITITGPSPPDITCPNVAKPPADSCLSEWIPYWCSMNKRPQAEADLLAASFNNVAAQIAAQVLQEPSEIIQATATANNAALGEAMPAWMPVLRQIQGEILAQAERGELTTPEQHKELWLTIATGLRVYATLN